MENDDLDDWNPAPGEHPTWSMEEIESHPLFMTSLQENVSNSHVEALQSVLYEEETPFSVANSLKNQGNEAFRLGLIADSIICYKRALESGCTDRSLLSQIHCNLALGFLRDMKYPECVDECYRAIGEDPANFKAFYRGALASLHLDLYCQGIYFAKGGLEADPENAELKAVLSQLEAKRESQLNAKTSVSESSSKIKPKYRWRDS